MHHLHFEAIESTQIYLKDHLKSLLEQDRNILVSAEHQTHGVGRSGNTWISNRDSLTLSLTISPHQELTLTTIEIGLLITAFLNKKFQAELKLKWPNDLMSPQGKKLGGIITYFYSPNCLVVGVGINFSPILGVEKYSTSYIEASAELDKKEISRELYEYLLEHRIHDTQAVVDLFNQTCAHHLQMVELDEDQKKLIGVWKGIDPKGAALIEIFNKTHSFLSGSLTMLTKEH